MTELEIMKHAKGYLDKLAQGIDPISGRRVPEDSTLNQLRLARCFQYVSGVLQQVIDNDGYVGRKPSISKEPFVLSSEALSSFRPSEQPMFISDFCGLLYTHNGNDEMRLPSSTKISNWLLEQGYLLKETDKTGKSHRFASEKGNQLGILSQKVSGKYGEYYATYYYAQAQRFLAEHINEILTRSTKEAHPDE